MSLIRVPVLFQGTKGEKILYALFDSGANVSCIHPEFVKFLTDPIPLFRPRKLGTANEGHYMEIKEVVFLDFILNDVNLADDFFVVPNLSEEIIFGAATLQKWRIKLDFEHEQVIVDPRVAKLQLV